MNIATRRIVTAATGLGLVTALTFGASASASAAPAAPATPNTPTRPTITAPTRPTVTAPTDPSNTPKGQAALDAIKQDGAQAIANRESQLTKLAGRLSSAPDCDSSGTIAGIIAADGPALTTLGNKLAADTDITTAMADLKSIFEDYRVYWVVTPQALVTSACGHIQTAVTKLTKDQAKLTDLVQKAAAGGADMTAAQKALDDMAARMTDATNHANHANTTLSAIAPDHGDKSVQQANDAAIQSAHTDLVTAHTDLTGALADAKTVVAALKAVGGAH